MNITVSVAKNVLAPSAIMVSNSAIHDATQRKMWEKGVVRAGKDINLVILNENITRKFSCINWWSLVKH